jgi:hypothetical protein
MICWPEGDMALGRANRERQEELRVATDQIVVGSGHAFYDRLNQVVIEPAVFDTDAAGYPSRF